AGLVLMLLGVAALAAWWVLNEGSPRFVPPPTVITPPAETPLVTAPPVAEDTAAGAAAAPSVDEGEGEASSPAAPPADAPVEQASPASPPASAAARLPMIEFDKDTYVVSEGDGAVRLMIHRSGPVAREVTFSWVLRPNSAESGADYADIGPGVERIP